MRLRSVGVGDGRKHLAGLSQEGHGLLEGNLRVYFLKDKAKSQILCTIKGGRIVRVEKIEILGDIESTNLASVQGTLFLTGQAH